MSYSQCAILASFDIDVSLCDCLKKSTAVYHTLEGTLNTEAKNSPANIDWNYTNNNSFSITIKSQVSSVKKHFSYYNQVLPNAAVNSVFRPPC